MYNLFREIFRTLSNIAPLCTFRPFCVKRDKPTAVIAIHITSALTVSLRVRCFRYHVGYAELGATRHAELESDVWMAVSRSQDAVVTRMENVIGERLES